MDKIDKARLALKMYDDLRNEHAIPQNNMAEYLRDALAATPLPEPLLALGEAGLLPAYHTQGMGCGLEDRGITDRYEAMQYGWDEAMQRAESETVAPLLARLQAAAAAPRLEVLGELADGSEEDAIAVVHEVLNDWLEENEATDFDTNDVGHLFGLLGTAGYSIVPNATTRPTAPAATAGAWVAVGAALPAHEEQVVAEVVGSPLHKEPYFCLLRYATYSDGRRRWCGYSGGLPCTAAVSRWLSIPAAHEPR